MSTKSCNLCGPIHQTYFPSDLETVRTHPLLFFGGGGPNLPVRPVASIDRDVDRSALVARRSEVFVYEKCRFDTDVSGFSKTFRSVHQFDVDDQAETGGEMERWTTQVGHTGNRVDGGPICPKGDSGLTCLTCKRCGGWGPVEGCKGGIVGAR